MYSIYSYDSGYVVFTEDLVYHIKTPNIFDVKLVDFSISSMKEIDLVELQNIYKKSFREFIYKLIHDKRLRDLIRYFEAEWESVCNKEVFYNKYFSQRYIFHNEERLIVNIKAAVSEVLHITIDSWNQKSREREICTYPRFCIMYFVKKYSRKSLRCIGEIFTPTLSHANVLHGIKVIKNLMETDKEKEREILQIEELILQNLNS